jgi:hypothetical protein
VNIKKEAQDESKMLKLLIMDVNDSFSEALIA